jgi:hypothetical protein
MLRQVRKHYQSGDIAENSNYKEVIRIFVGGTAATRWAR